MYPLATEKSMRILEAENKVIIMVEKDATRREIKDGFEKEFKVKVDKVNICVTKGGKKKAYIKIKEGNAADIATKLGVF